MIYHTEDIAREDYLALLSVDEVKSWAKIQYSLEDNLIEGLIIGTIRTVERMVNRDLVPRLRSVLFDYDDLSSEGVELRGDLVQIALVQQQDTNGDWEEIESSYFAYQGDPVTVCRNVRRWSTSGISPVYRVTYQTGQEYVEGDTFQEDMKAALKLIITAILNTGREAVSSVSTVPVPMNARMMLRSYIKYN